MITPLTTPTDETTSFFDSKHILLSNAGALMHVVKGTVGTGILGLPWAIKHAGIIVGPLVMVFIGIVNLHCMQLLVESARHLASVLKCPPLDYGEAALLAFRHGPITCLRSHGLKAKFFVNICLEMTQLGLCCTYTVFVGQNVRQIIAVYWYNAPDDRVFMAALFLPFVLICMIKSLPILAWFSSAANVAGIIAICMMMRYLLPELPPVYTRPYVADISGFAVFVGAAVGAFEGIPVILPIGNAMRTPEDFSLIINIGISIIIFLYVCMAFVGYLKFGAAICGSITLNLPINEPYYDTVRILYSFAIFFTFPLQFYVAMEIIETAIVKKLQPKTIWCGVITRTSFIAIICLVSIGIPYIGDLNSLIGATSSTMLVVLFPPLLHIMAYNVRESNEDESDDTRGIITDAENTTGDDDAAFGLSNWIMTKDLIIAVLAMLAFAMGLAQVIISIVHDLQNYNSKQACSGGVGTFHDNYTSMLLKLATNVSNSTLDSSFT